MRVKFLASDKKREQQLAKAFMAGVQRDGVAGVIEPLSAMPDLDNIDVACMIGVKSKRLFDRCREAGVVPILFDKGYLRHRRADARTWEYWRVSIASHHPTRYLYEGKANRARLQLLHLDVKRWRGYGLQIVLAGSSQKYHDFYGLPDPTTWAKEVVAEIRKHTDRPIIYRPKPSWQEAVEIEGTFFSKPTENIASVLGNAWALVTHGSNACFEAALMGVPSIILGDAVAKPISSTSIEDINDPMMGERGNWLQRLVHWQWTEREMSRGHCWRFMKPHIADLLEGRERWPR